VQIPKKKKQRGGFDDLLGLYADRHVGILQDEIDEINQALENKPTTILEQDELESEAPFTFSNQIQTWLRHQYGVDETQKLSHPTFLRLAEKEQLETMQHFLSWFREQFPYFYDVCDSCGASYREDTSDQQNEEIMESVDIGDNNNKSELADSIVVIDGDKSNNFTSSEESKAFQANNVSYNINDISSNQILNNDEDKEEGIEGTFLGYVYPIPQELSGKASRTELYHCHKCQHYTRFPRYNAVSSIVKCKRGRCGEYSILLYRILRDLGHNARWVVDWADHVWVECLIEDYRGDEAGRRERTGSFSTIEEKGAFSKRLQRTYIPGRWIHLDPCEAAVDRPLLYQDWGKKQTFIIAFWAPLQNIMQSGKQTLESSTSNLGTPFPLIEDVTQKYTTDCVQNIRKRRAATDDSVKLSLSAMEARLQNLIASLAKP